MRRFVVVSRVRSELIASDAPLLFNLRGQRPRHFSFKLSGELQ